MALGLVSGSVQEVRCCRLLELKLMAGRIFKMRELLKEGLIREGKVWPHVVTLIE